MVRALRHGFSGAVIVLWSVAGGFAQEVSPTAQPTATGKSAEPAAAAQIPDSVVGVAREIDAELVRLRHALDVLARFRGDLEKGAADHARAVESAEERVAELTVALHGSIDAGEPADTVYDTVVTELGDVRARLHEVLDSLHAPSQVPTYEPRLDLETMDVASFRLRIDTVRGLIAELAAAAQEARSFEGQQRWTNVEALGRLVRRFNGLRIECLEWLSPGRRARVLGVSRDGIGQLMREVDHVVLSARLYRETRLHQLREAKTLTRDLFVLGALSYALLRLGLVMVAIFWARTRWRTWLDRLRRRLFRRARGVVWKRRSDALLALAEAVLPWTLFLTSVAAIRWALRPAVTAPELAVLYELALIYGLYRLSIDLFVALLVRVAHRYGLRMAVDRRAKLLQTVRWVMRVAVPLVMMTVEAQRVVGRGYIYHVVVRFSWVVLLLTLLGIVISWRGVAAESYLKAHPTGRLARSVRRSQGRWYGILVTPVCFVWTAGRALVVFARDIALGFDQTRKALAFVFRHRIERQAEVRGYAGGDIEELPNTVVEAFTEDAVSEGPLVVDFFPEMDQIEAAFNGWLGDSTGGSFLLTGERGSGKTTWLHQIPSGDLPKTLIALDKRPVSADDLAQILGNGLASATASPWDLDRLGVALLDGPRRVVIVDLAQHLFLATVGGYAAFDGFASLIEGTRNHVFWVCGMSAFAWRQLRAVRPTPQVFRHHVALGSWSEERIRELVRARVAAAEVKLNYGDLVVDRLEGVSNQARLIESDEGYTRLLWDYSDGNPRVALHFFLRSLVPESAESVRVRLFRAPPVEALERLDESALFTLAATIAHENLTLEEAARVTRYTEQLCRIHLDRLTELGVLRVEDDRYRVTTFWHRAAVRLLRRLNLLND